MCLWNPGPLKRAWRPITVYKVLKSAGSAPALFSPYQGTEWRPGWTHRARIGEPSKLLFGAQQKIEEGLHAFTGKLAAKYLADSGSIWFPHSNLVVVPMRIPRFAKYREGHGSEIVSSALHWPKRRMVE